MTSLEILISIIGAISGWTLLEVVAIGKKVASLDAIINSQNKLFTIEKKPGNNL